MQMCGHGLVRGCFGSTTCGHFPAFLLNLQGISSDFTVKREIKRLIVAHVLEPEGYARLALAENGVKEGKSLHLDS